MICVLIHHPGARACSESDTTRSMRAVLHDLYGVPPVENPTALPTMPYDLWALVPRTCLNLTNLPYWSDPNCQAAITVDMDDGAGPFDLYLPTLEYTEPMSAPIQALAALWGSSYDPYRGRPRLPYHHAIPREDVEIGYQPGAPRDYVVWNCEHHQTCRDEASYAETIIPLLIDLGITNVVATRVERAGYIEALDQDSRFKLAVASDSLSHEDYCQVLGAAFCYVLSTPTTGMLSMERALAFGVPIYAAPRGRWREHFSTLSELFAARCASRASDSYGSRSGYYSELFSTANAVRAARHALDMAHQLREQCRDA